MSAATDLVAFRRQFPALERVTYLNTATTPPAARPVLEALRRAEGEWEGGEFSWQAWEREAHATRRLFAGLVGSEADRVALMGSVAEAAATVAASLPPGRVVVGEREFRSNLLPWVALRDRGFEVVEVEADDGVVTTERLASAVEPGAVLVAVSDVQSSNGFRVRLGEIASACRAAGARLFVNVTQSVGALRFDPAVEADYVAAHGYKWLLAPRGAAWLAVRPDRLDELRPLLPNWHSVEEPYADYYGSAIPLSSAASRLDTSMAWLPWVGARAALDLLARLDAGALERRCLELAAAFRAGAADRGYGTVREEAASHIVAVDVPDAGALKRRLAERRVIAAVRGGFLRLGFHAFNDPSDVEAALDALPPLGRR
ncbi:MAG TPA: aminotransferase class V-fold PLP-dependent enzyme [Actinomycetota bacterium]|nr:aminotransferase class V-fold PLP-dependent enzyme [Actinomycetota bacterium]